MRLHILALLALGLAATAAEPLKIWSAANAADLAQLAIWSKEKGAIERKISADVKAPDGQPAFELIIKAAKPEVKPTEIQAMFVYKGGLKAGQEYTATYTIKAIASGMVHSQATLQEKPWTTIVGTDAKIAVTPEWQTVTVRIKAAQDYTEQLSTPRLFLGTYGVDTTVYIGSVVLTQVEAK